MIDAGRALLESDEALLRELGRLDIEIGRHFPAGQDVPATPADHRKLLSLIDDLARVSDDLRAQRDALEKQISAADNASIATQAYQGARPRNQ